MKLTKALWSKVYYAEHNGFLVGEIYLRPKGRSFGLRFYGWYYGKWAGVNEAARVAELLQPFERLKLRPKC